METNTLKLQGMSCASCARSVEDAMRSVPGVAEVNVNFGAEQANIQYDPKQTDLEQIQQAIVDAGYSSYSLQDQEFITDETEVEKTARLREFRQLRQKIIVAGVISVVLVVGSLPMMLGLPIPFIPLWLHNSWLQLVLSTPVLFWAGREFFINAWKAVKRHTATMDTLVALGTGSAYLYSIVATVIPGFFMAQGLNADVYYEAANVIITLILLGRLLETRARGQTSDAIRKLIGLQAR
ncbi:MAG: cation transporter, partial [Phormidesmis sp. CAN_BIN36]|nr:cation transporter [Phormidesmis sp. CAN_BIN36]